MCKRPREQYSRLSKRDKDCRRYISRKKKKRGPFIHADAYAENTLPMQKIPWPPDAKSQLIGIDPDAGED